MKIAYFDCFSGISGDMALGALIDLGVPAGAVISELQKLPLKHWSFDVSRERRGAIEGTRVVIGAKDQPHRSFSDIETILSESGLEAWVEDKSLAIFQSIAQAEGRVHGVDPAHVHFHEVGAVDSIMDIVGTAFCLKYLAIEKLYGSPVPMGRGFIETQHGTIPLPAPATVSLLSGVPVYGTSIDRELVTPTGAGIISTLAAGFGQAPPMTLLSTGYGVGTHPSANPPNLLRILLGEARPAAIVSDLLMIETNIDDMNPEFYNYTLEKLFALGALDVTIIPVQMKKNRPGVLLRVLVEPVLEQATADLLFTETTTLGIRVQDVKRIEVPREARVVSTRFGPCKVKRVVLPNGSERMIPEYEECRRIARERGIPIPDVYRNLLTEAN